MSSSLMFLFALIVTALSDETQCVAARPMSQVWRVERKAVESHPDDLTTLLLFDYDGGSVSPRDSHAVLAEMSQQLRSVGVSASVPMAVSLEASGIRVVLRDRSSAVCEILFGCV
jgi:hypothetical protein